MTEREALVVPVPPFPAQYGELTEWLVKPGASVFSGQTLAHVRMPHPQSGVLVALPVKAASDGTLDDIKVSVGQRVCVGDELAGVTVCGHPVVYGGICAVCQKDVTTQHYSRDEPEATSSHVSLVHGQSELRATVERAAAVSQRHRQDLLAARKLVLILDLDSTLVNVTVDTHQGEKAVANGHVEPGAVFQLRDQVIGQRRWANSTYYLNLRPGCREFLRAMSSYFEMHVYTAGSLEYAKSVARVLDDEHGSLLGQRLHSARIDVTEKDKSLRKTIQRLFPGDDSIVLIVDDRDDVWAETENVVKIFPYHYFDGPDVNALPQDAPTPSDGSAGDGSGGGAHAGGRQMPLTQRAAAAMRDPHLSTIAGVLARVHHDFFAEIDDEVAQGKKPPHVADCLGAVKRSVLAGCHILFSGVIPTNHRYPEKTAIWRMAVALGATVHTAFDSPLITHVVTSSLHTAKAQSALQRPGVWIVTENWLACCDTCWVRVAESDFAFLPDITASLLQHHPDTFRQVQEGMELLVESMHQLYTQIHPASSSTADALVPSPLLPLTQSHSGTSSSRRSLTCSTDDDTAFLLPPRASPCSSQPRSSAASDEDEDEDEDAWAAQLEAQMLG